METCALEELGAVKELIQISHRSHEPVIVLEGGDECLVAMTPAVFERILFESNLLNIEGRHTLFFG